MICASAADSQGISLPIECFETIFTAKIGNQTNYNRMKSSEEIDQISRHFEMDRSKPNGRRQINKQIARNRKSQGTNQRDWRRIEETLAEMVGALV